MKVKPLKLRRCKFCKELFQPSQPLQYLCFPPKNCAWEWQKKLSEKLKVNKWRDEKKVMVEKLMTLSDYKKILQSHINFIIRAIDYGQPCIATGATTGKRNAGHYISTGSNDTLRFHLDNIHIQSEQSNSWKSGDTLRYQRGIKRIYGKEYLDHLNSLQSIEPIKLSIQELKEKIIIAKNIKKRMVEGMIYEVSDRLSMRKLFNKELGIYK